jgi:hypothetical protein
LIIELFFHLNLPLSPLGRGVEVEESTSQEGNGGLEEE